MFASFQPGHHARRVACLISAVLSMLVMLTVASPAAGSSTTATRVASGANVTTVVSDASTAQAAASDWKFYGYVQRYQSIRCKTGRDGTVKVVAGFLGGTPYDRNKINGAWRGRAESITVSEGADKNGKPVKITYHGGLNFERLDPGKGKKKKHAPLKVYFPGSDKSGEAGSSLHWTAVLPNDFGEEMVTNVGTYRRNATLKGWRKPLHVPLTAKYWKGQSPHHGYLDKRSPSVSIRAQVLYKGKICKPIVMSLPNPIDAMQMQATDKSVSFTPAATSATMPTLSNASFTAPTSATAEPARWKFVKYLSTSAPIHCGGDDGRVVGRVHAGVGWEKNQYDSWRVRDKKTKVRTEEFRHGKRVYKTYPAGIHIHKQGKSTLSFPGFRQGKSAGSIKWLATVPTADGSEQYEVAGAYKSSPKLRTETFNVKVSLAAKRWNGESPHAGISDLWDPYVHISVTPRYKGKACKRVTLHLYNPNLFYNGAAKVQL